MTVYEVRTSGDHFSAINSGLSFESEKREQLIGAMCTGHSLSQIWTPLQCTRRSPEFEDGHFAAFRLANNLIVTYQETLEIKELPKYLEDTCELLEISIDESPAHVVNVTRILDALDFNQSRLVTRSSGRRSTSKPVFNLNNLPTEGGFFRILESWNRVYLAEPDSEGFKSFYDTRALTGLYFKECVLAR